MAFVNQTKNYDMLQLMDNRVCVLKRNVPRVWCTMFCRHKTEVSRDM